MTLIASTPPGAAAAPAGADPLPASRVLLLATGAGLAVASIYYSQPLLGVLASDLPQGAGQVGLVPTLTQLGYALGILLLSPLGDRFDRRRLIAAKSALLALALAAAGLAPGIGSLLAASLAVGLAATLAQDIVPAAATLAAPERRGKAVGTVMTGLLLGILLSRVVSGLVAQAWGWRSVYAAAAAAIGLLGVALWRGLPHFRPDSTLGYRALLATLPPLWRRHAALRRAAWAQALLSLGFSAFWSTLAVMLHSRFHWGSAAAGAFGLAGAAGALAAPLAGRLADRRGPEPVIRLGALLAMASFGLMALDGWLPPQAQWLLLVVGAIGFDFGIQAALVAHQTQVYGLDPQARSRLNALLFTTMFVGMAAGSALGSGVLALAGWHGVLMLGMASAGAALALRCWPRRTAQ
ncbi:MFS transporter [Aquabacterium sp.]|uniref:MFS transporter n=1 Tax=Aquabacterium sp. TaxID=1872578 RepID=UPI0037852716